MLALLGSIALGLVWGWYLGLWRLPQPRPLLALGAALFFALALGTLAWLLVSTTAALALLAGVAIGYLLHAAWLDSIRTSSTTTHSSP